MPTVSAAQERLMQAAAHTPGGFGGVPQSVGKEFTDSDGTSCAGIMFRAPGPLFLLVRRSDNGQWEQPGGHLEASENPEQAAVRECIEECGICPEGHRYPARICATNGIRYLQFIQDVESFVPTLNHEHTEYAWVGPAEVPENTHPEVVRAIHLLSGNELTVATAMKEGDLLSPQRFENIWLFDLRITGTGTSYRQAMDEYVYRPPENFLTDEFVARCNGLPIIFEHPKTLLDTDEYRERAIGTVMLPYIRNDEVRGIAKIFDSDASVLMMGTHASTSPAVVFRAAGSTETIELQDGRTILIEGTPSYLDHLAICEDGVWDKGGISRGINLSANQSEDRLMPEEIKVEEPKVEEEKVPAWADALGKRLDSLHARMDAIEQKGGEQMPPKEMPVLDEDKKAEEKEQEKREAEIKADAAKSRADMQARIDSLTSQIDRLTKPMDSAERDELASIQMRADALAQMLGDSITAPLFGESPISYRKRLASKFKKHSKEFKDYVLDSIDGPGFKIVEDRIYADAQTVALHPSEAMNGRLIPMVRRDSAGREITTFTGDINGFLGPFKAEPVRIRFNTPARKENN